MDFDVSFDVDVWERQTMFDVNSDVGRRCSYTSNYIKTTLHHIKVFYVRSHRGRYPGELLCLFLCSPTDRKEIYFCANFYDPRAFDEVRESTSLHRLFFVKNECMEVWGDRWMIRTDGWIGLQQNGSELEQRPLLQVRVSILPLHWAPL